MCKTSKQTKREAQALAPHGLLDWWQVTDTVDLQVWRTANTPVCVMSNIRTCGVICEMISCCPHYRDAVYLEVLCAVWSWSDKRQIGPGVESLQVTGPRELYRDERTHSSVVEASVNILATFGASILLHCSILFGINSSLTWKSVSICCDLLSCSASTMTSDNLWTMTWKGPWGSRGWVRSICEEGDVLNLMKRN